MTAHVVVGVDGSASALTAVRWAAADAARRGCALRIVHACERWAYDSPAQPPPGFRDPTPEHCGDVLAAAVRTARAEAPGIEVSTESATGRAVEVLGRAAEDAVQVVVGARGTGGFAGLALGSVVLGLAGHAAAPVVAVRELPGHVHGRVVVGFDGCDHSAAALRYAFDEAARRGARLCAVHACPAPVLAGAGAVGASRPAPAETVASARRDAERTLAPWREAYPEVAVEPVVIAGRALEAICTESAGADLVVVGSRGLSALASALLGSVSHGVLHHARCPVIAVVGPRWPGPSGRT